MYSPEEFKAKMNEILENSADVGLVSEILTDVLNNYSAVLTLVSEMEQEMGTLKEHNASLIKANGELFMNVGIGKAEAEEVEELVEFADLDEVLEDILDEKGRFKS